AALSLRQILRQMRRSHPSSVCLRQPPSPTRGEGSEVGILIPYSKYLIKSNNCAEIAAITDIDLRRATLYHPGLRPIHLVRAAFFVFQDPHHAEEHHGFAEAGRGREEV